MKMRNPLGIPSLTAGLSHLKKHKFSHSFQYSVNSLSSGGRSIESTIHFFLHCINDTFQRSTL